MQFDFLTTNLLPKPPRKVRLRAEAFPRVWLPRLGAIPLVAAGLFAIWSIIEIPLTQMMGNDAIGRVEQVTPFTGKGSRSLPDGRHFSVGFTYDIDGTAPKMGYGVIDTGGASPPVVGQSIPVRTLVLGPMGGAELRDGWQNTAGLVGGGLFVSLWCTVIFIGASIAWLGPMFDKRLVREGRAVAGIVTSKKENRGRGRFHYQISYRYRLPDGAEQLGSAGVTSQLFKSLQESQLAIVLYNSTFPERSALYESLKYEVSGAD
jgi:hypothetical protein